MSDRAKATYAAIRDRGWCYMPDLANKTGQVLIPALPVRVLRAVRQYAEAVDADYLARRSDDGMGATIAFLMWREEKERPHYAAAVARARAADEAEKVRKLRARLRDKQMLERLREAFESDESRPTSNVVLYRDRSAP